MRNTKTEDHENVLVIDVGGTNIKLLASGQKIPRKIPSGPAMTAKNIFRDLYQSYPARASKQGQLRHNLPQGTKDRKLAGNARDTGNRQ